MTLAIFIRGVAEKDTYCSFLSPKKEPRANHGVDKRIVQ